MTVGPTVVSECRSRRTFSKVFEL